MANNQLTGGYEVADLNPRDPISNEDSPIKLPFPDDSFDVVTCVVSIDYLTRPVEVLKEVKRVLKVGGKVIISQSNRFFPSKVRELEKRLAHRKTPTPLTLFSRSSLVDFSLQVVNMWLNMNDRQHLEVSKAHTKYSFSMSQHQPFLFNLRLLLFVVAAH